LTLLLGLLIGFFSALLIPAVERLFTSIFRKDGPEAPPESYDRFCEEDLFKAKAEISNLHIRLDSALKLQPEQIIKEIKVPADEYNKKTAGLVDEAQHYYWFLRGTRGETRENDEFGMIMHRLKLDSEARAHLQTPSKAENPPRPVM